MNEQHGTAAKRDWPGHPWRKMAELCGIAILAACDRQRPAEAAPTATRADPNAVASRFSPAGSWQALPPASGVLRITPAGTAWRVSVRTSGPDRGDATPADCEVEAEGALRGTRIAARLVPFETEISTVTAEQVARSPATVRVTFQGDHADVATDYQGCGLGAYAGGRFVRAASEAHRPERRSLAAGDDLAAVAARYPGATLTIVEGYPWARFAVAGGPVFTFDGENGELLDGSNTQSRIGDHVAWSDLKPQIKLVRIEPWSRGQPLAAPRRPRSGD